MTDKKFLSYCQKVISNFNSLEQLAPTITTIINICETSLKAGGKIIFIGNGGSAADSQHLAAELVGRYQKDRIAIPALALTTDTSALTAIGNDLGYEKIFSRQLEALAKKGDILFALSTSGNSANILHAIATAKNIGMVVIGMTGSSLDSKINHLCHHLINAPSSQTNHIQEMHIAIGHFICGMLEEKLSS
ncbi:MAG: D-sedoheptulose-7-phosphate isomerase [Alphaproteobacteria bacterium]